MGIENLKGALPEYAKDLELDPRLDHPDHGTQRDSSGARFWPAPRPCGIRRY